MKNAVLHLITLLGVALFGATVSVAEIAPSAPVLMDRALSDAKALVAGRSDLSVVRVEGNSMLPFFGNGSVLVVKKTSLETIKSGMLVVYRNNFGETVAHRVMDNVNGEWAVKGYNNAAYDSTRLTEGNLLGTVYVTLQSNNRVGDSVGYAALSSSTSLAMAAPAK